LEYNRLNLNIFSWSDPAHLHLKIEPSPFLFVFEARLEDEGINKSGFLNSNIATPQATSLKKVTCSALTPIHPARITKSEILNDPGKPDISNLNGQMNMIGHQTKGMDAVSITFGALLQ